MKTISMYVVLVLLSGICHGQHTLLFADSIRKAYHIPALSYAVVTGNSTEEIGALGLHSVDLKEAASLEDRFHIGSNTKAMTAFMIAKYVERGRLQWTTRFFDLFPDWRQDARAEYENMTLQDLLTHRARVQPFQGQDDPAIPTFEGSRQQRRTAFGKFVLTLPPVPLDSLQAFTYSNAGYTLAALMLEKVSGKTWEELVVAILNRRLRLNVRFSWPENQNHSDTWGHTFENGHWTPVPSNTDYRLEYTEPAGDLNIRLRDYVKFIQLNLEGLAGKRNFLRPETYAFIHDGVEGYALGWYNSHDDGRAFSTHAGTAGTYFTLASLDRDQYIGYIIFTNAFSEETIAGVKQLMRKLKTDHGS